MARRILFVGLPNSVHLARWVRLIADQGWELHLFPVHNEPAHEDLRHITVHWPDTRVGGAALLRAIRAVKRTTRSAVVAFEGRLGLDPLYLPAHAHHQTRLVKPRNPTRPFGSETLAAVIEAVKPDLIHSMEFQKAGYVTLDAKPLLRGCNPAWLATNWGSDIYYYRTQPEHYVMIRRMLREIDLYSCECYRDVDLAHHLGLKKPVLPVVPNSGGFDFAELAMVHSNLPPSRRRRLMVKGYQHFAGRAMTALDAVEGCRDLLHDYDITVFAGSPAVKQRVASMAENGWRIRAPEYIRHLDMMRLYAHSRVYLGVSISDAISTSLLEAMAMGCFPVQTDTSCCEEWIEHGVSGFAIPYDDLDVIIERLRCALTDDELVDNAAALNQTVIRERLDLSVMKQRILDFYDEAFRLVQR